MRWLILSCTGFVAIISLAKLSAQTALIDKEVPMVVDRAVIIKPEEFTPERVERICHEFLNAFGQDRGMRRLIIGTNEDTVRSVLFWALDRFSREGALETLQRLNQLSNYGVAFRSFTEPYLDSCGIFKDAVIAILRTVAKQERVRISERVRAGLSRARAQGTKSGEPIGRPGAVFARDQALELRAQGLSWREISRRMGASVAGVRRACQCTQPS